MAKDKQLIWDTIEKLEQQTTILYFIAEMLNTCKNSENYDEFFITGTQASLENAADNIIEVKKEFEKFVKKQRI